MTAGSWDNQPCNAGCRQMAFGMFHRNQLQRRIRGQAGKQHFFTLKGRPFCLYVVLGSIGHAPKLVAKANEMLRGMSVEGA